jgi:serine/threonine protein kinase
VVSAKDTKEEDEENQRVAIKKIEKVFEHSIFAKRCLRELKILRLLQHNNIIQVREVLIPEKEDFDDIYVVYELMDTDLSAIIKSNQELSEEHTQYFLYQILRGLKFIHSANIIHRDLV